MRPAARLASFVYFLGVAIPTLAGFASTEVFLPAVGRIPGQGGAQFYTTLWATNLTAAPQTFKFELLKVGQKNPTPASFTDTLQPGQTKVYENVVESKLGLANALGAGRVTSSGEIFVSERIYNVPPGADLGNTEGLFFAGVPKTFSISAGQSASIQGIDQGASENFRYNFALVETGGGSPTVNVQVFDGSGALLGQKSYPLQPYEQLQPGVGDVVPGISTTNARITATVTGGTGSVLLAGAQLANESQDSSGFEMTFRDSLLSGTSSGGGLTAVVHDGTLIGSGTASIPLGLNPAAVVTSLNGAHGAVSLAAGSNVTITPSGQTLTIAASGGGGGGGLTLPFSGTTSATGFAFDVTSTGTSGAIRGASTGGPAGVGGETGVFGEVQGGFGSGVAGNADGEGNGVVGSASTGLGVYGVSSSGTGTEGDSMSGDGVYGSSSSGHGVVGTSFSTGVNASAIYANSAGSGGIALFATNDGTDATIVATNNSSGAIFKGFSNGGTEVFEVNANGVSLPQIYGAPVTTNSVCINSTTLVLCGASSLRFKKDVENMGTTSNLLLNLRPVTFRYKADPEGASPTHFGLIAEEVVKVSPDLVLRDHDGKPSGVRYEELSSLLLNEFQKEHSEVAALAQKAAQLERANQGLEIRLAEEEKTQAARLAVLERKLSLMEKTVFTTQAASR